MRLQRVSGTYKQKRRLIISMYHMPSYDSLCIPIESGYEERLFRWIGLGEPLEGGIAFSVPDAIGLKIRNPF